MDNRLDRLFSELATIRTDRSLEYLDFEIGRAISRRRYEARAASAFAPIWMASIVLALTMGFTLGGATAATATTDPPWSTSLSMAEHLAPSALLEDVR